MQILRYDVELQDGTRLDLLTDYDSAREKAIETGGFLIEHIFEWSDSQLIEDCSDCDERDE